MKQTIALSPRVALVLGHIETVREVYGVIGGEFGQEMKRLRTRLDGILLEEIPELKTWTREESTNENALYYYPASWKVRGDAIALWIVLGNPEELDPSDGEPYVGLYVPRRWRGLAALTHMLKAKGNRPDGFDHICKHAAENYDETNPIWAYVSYARYARKGKFDTLSFVRKIVLLSKRIVSKKERVDSMIELAAKGSKH